MKNAFRALAALSFLLLASCATKRTPFSPDGPVTVGMPAELSERERLFAPELNTALQREGLVPVNSGKGDLQLDFSMNAGPINITTAIALKDGKKTIATGNGRAAGAPLIGRSKTAQKSFTQAFDEFQENLSRIASRRGWSNSNQRNSPIHTPELDPIY